MEEQTYYDEQGKEWNSVKYKEPLKGLRGFFECENCGQKKQIIEMREDGEPGDKQEIKCTCGNYMYRVNIWK